MPVSGPGNRLVVGDGGYARIADAVADAREGDTVSIRPGRYPESVKVTKSISLIGEGPRGAVIIAGESGPCLAFLSCEPHVTGLTVVGGSGRPAEWPPERHQVHGAIHVVDCEASFEDLQAADHSGIVVHGGAVAITNSRLVGGREDGLLVMGGAVCTVEDVEMADTGVAVRVFENDSQLIVRRGTVKGGIFGIMVGEGAAATIENTEFVGCSAAAIHTAGHATVRHAAIRDGKGKAIECEGGDLTVEDTQAVSNVGGGIAVGEGARAVIRRSTVRDARNSGIDISDGARVVIEDSDISATECGICVRDESSSAEIRRNQLHDGYHDGILVLDSASAVIEENTIVRHQGVGIYIGSFFDATGNTVLLRENTITDGSREGIVVAADSPATIERNQVRGNAAGSIVTPSPSKAILDGNLTDVPPVIGDPRP